MTKWSFWNCFKLEKNKRGIVSSYSKCKKGEKRGRAGESYRRLGSHFLERESVFLLSRFLKDPTVRIRWDEKKSCSTHRGQRVDTGFEEFQQTP